ncbi:MAG TPA: prolyl oligopeptidase family serine peptidase, partial [Thermomicrobiales bacterium]|nr:prolyl oligopeptidase family serine peptidase [Thermomicrobiales bacterium]
IASDLVAWLDDRSGVMQLYAGNPITGERRQLTTGAERIQSLIGTAGSRRVIVGTDAGGNERQQLAVIDLDSGEQQLLTEAPDQIHEPFCLGPDGEQVVYRTNNGASGEFSLHVMDIASRETRCLWNDAGQIRAHAMNDGGEVLTSLLTSNLDADLYLISPNGVRTALLQTDDESWILDAGFALDGEHVFVLTNAGSEFVRLVRIDRQSGKLDVLVDTGWDIETMALSPDSSRLAWSVNREGYSDIFVAPLDAHESATRPGLPEGVADRLSWSPDNDSIVVGWTPVDAPARLWTVESGGEAAQTFADDPIDEKFTGKPPELIRFDTFDGRQIPAFWFESDRADAPVVIDVHGGPESQRRAAFHPVLQYLVAAGFHVLTTNVRGSTGYGKAYQHLDDVELRMNSVRDLEYACEWAADRLRSAEPKIGIMGQSYGGFMTLAAITEFPDRWFAAADVVGIANFVTFLERTGPWRRRHRSAEYGSLERDRELLERISPIRKVEAIEAPMLVIHGRNDPRVPLYEAEQLVESLEERNHPVELLVFDNEGHGLSKRPNRIEGYAKVAEFYWRIAGGSA